MKIELYSVRDTLLCYSQPFPAENEQVALRMFIASVRSPQPNACNTFPENKELWKIGSFDDKTGKLYTDLRHIANAQSYVIECEPEKIIKEQENGGKEDGRSDQ